MKRKSIFIVMLVSVMILASGCQGKTNTSSGSNKTSDPVVITQSGFYVYPKSSGGEFGIGAYCEFKNVSNDDIIVKKINTKGYDSSNVALGDDYMVFAPNYLKAGEVGYAAVPDEFGIKVTSKDELSRIEYSFITEKPKGSEFNLSCADPTISPDSGYGGDKNKNMILTTVENSTNKAIDGKSYSLVAGLFDSNGKLIGGAKNFGTSSSVDPNGKAKLMINEIVLESNDLTQANSISAKAWVNYNAFN